MRGLSKKRLQEGALSALRTPENLPAPPELVPAPSSSAAGEDRSLSVGPKGTASSESVNSRLVEVAVDRAKAGDDEGLHFLYVRYQPDLQRYVASFVRDRHEAEDITQNIFAQLMTTIQRYEPLNVPFAAWIMRVARNAALDSLRAKRPASTEEHVDHGQALRQALEQLPEDQREVLILRHIAGLSPIEIAATLKKSESSVHALQHRGRRTLQERLAEVTERQHALWELVQE
jgi:RNA polymerase sigma-70 factor (ECF subfamily)